MIYTDKKKKPEVDYETVHKTEPIMADFELDPNGSWTGVCIDKYEKPVQDVDDL